MSAAGEERLRQAMLIATNAPEGPPLEEVIAKRDELLALA